MASDDSFPNSRDQLYSISLGSLVAWPVIGLILAFYVRGQTKDQSSRNSYAQMTFWLVGLAIFHMWLLWFSMYSAHNYP